MVKSNRQAKFLELRLEFPFFAFEKQEYSLSKAGLHVQYTFNLSDRYYFKPSFFIPRKSCFLPDASIAGKLDNILFNIGMIELISYWKVTCSPTVILYPFAISPEQVAWWKKLYFHGLGEFFYLNSITEKEESFMQVKMASGKLPPVAGFLLSDGVIIPVGGGKDSSVTLEILGPQRDCIPLIMNPRGASLETIFAGGYRRDECFEIIRTLDPLLLKLNEEGFLNGHTPFSALLAFYTTLASIMTSRRHVALSNESSANEATIEGTTINHQYSKSLVFEGDYRKYVNESIAPGINYFSFLRPLNELQIASLFSGFTAYHKVFRSCNVGSKTDSWCGRCAKCLFTYIILSPFLTQEKLIAIFGKNLLDANDPEMKLYFDQLAGIAHEKPFDCVGTINEVNLALCEILRRHGQEELPALLAWYRSSSQYDQYRDLDFRDALSQIGRDHFLLPEFMILLSDVRNA
ncbi:MAG: hypothetical protein M0P58_00835 [Bacteroidales bacterium]|nr:hypothetical protein [Bacteroidales bacterium]